MPAELLIDREKVKMVALQIGVREAARQFGLNENTVMAWSIRYNWFGDKALADGVKEAVIEQRGLQAAARKSPADIVKSLGDRSKLRLSRTVDKTALHLYRQKPDKLIENTSALLNTTSAWAKLHGDVPTAPSVAIQINLGGRFD